jgi:hypothetical protein
MVSEKKNYSYQKNIKLFAKKLVFMLKFNFKITNKNKFKFASGNKNKFMLILYKIIKLITKHHPRRNLIRINYK